MDEQKEVDYGAMIGKMKRGDKVIVTLISEPLQEQYIELMKFTKEFKAALKKAQDMYNSPADMSVQEARDLKTMDFEYTIKKDTFWHNIYLQYDIWKIDSVGLRNGFCLVRSLGPMDMFKKFKDVMDEFMEEMGHDADNEG